MVIHSDSELGALLTLLVLFAGITGVYLLDDRGRRFELMNDPSVVPFDTPLDPRQSIRTTFTFVAAADAQHLFLPCSYHHIGDEASVPFWVKLYLGGESNYLRKRTMLRVL